MKNTKKMYKRKLRKTRKIYKKKGGDIQSNKFFNFIKSIGFELETVDLVKLTLMNDNGKDILVNSSLVNADIETGFVSDEYIYIDENQDEPFKVTNDIAKDSLFNIELKKIYDMHIKYDDDVEDDVEEKNHMNENDDEDLERTYDCDTTIFKLMVDRNRYLKQREYEIKFITYNNDDDSDFKIINCSPFSDTEYIATYYKPEKSDNIIKNYLFKTIDRLNKHLENLVYINGQFMVKDKDNNFVKVGSMANKLYYLLDSKLLYLNSSNMDNPNFKITDDLELVIQMTFSCDIENIYEIMINLHNLDWNKYKGYMGNVRNFYNLNKNNENIIELLQKVRSYKENSNIGIHGINICYEIAQQLISKLKNNNKNISKDVFKRSNLWFKKITNYLFLIIHKIYIYVNHYYLHVNVHGNSILFKRWSDYMIRHDNATILNAIKRLLNDDNDDFILDMLDEKILNKIYGDFINEIRLIEHIKENTDEDNYGDPYYSIKNYFEYMLKNNEDWLVVKGIDEGSTKFELINDTVIVEFRGFPEYLYAEIFFTGDDEMRNRLIKNPINCIDLKTLNLFIKSQRQNL